MLDDIIEIAVDLLGDVLEIVIKSKRHGKTKSRKTKRNQDGGKKLPPQDPWEQPIPTPPWEK